MFSFPELMKRVFKDPEMQRQFEEQGYVTVQFYTAEEIASLNKLYDDLHPQDEKGFYPSTFSQDKNYRQKADEAIRRIGNRTMDSILENQRVVCGSHASVAACVHGNVRSICCSVQGVEGSMDQQHWRR